MRTFILSLLLLLCATAQAQRPAPDGSLPCSIVLQFNLPDKIAFQDVSGYWINGTLHESATATTYTCDYPTTRKSYFVFAGSKYVLDFPSMRPEVSRTERHYNIVTPKRGMPDVIIVFNQD